MYPLHGLGKEDGKKKFLNRNTGSRLFICLFVHSYVYVLKFPFQILKCFLSLILSFISIS